MIYLALGALVLALLVWAGRRSPRTISVLRLAVVALAIAAAGGAAYEAVRGQWLGSIVLLGLSIYTVQTQRAVKPKTGNREPANTAGMSASEARSILGVGPEATTADIQAAYLRLIQRVHPDRGGAAGLAAQLNAARDRLLK